jgi:hypothetical protein
MGLRPGRIPRQFKAGGDPGPTTPPVPLRLAVMAVLAVLAGKTRDRSRLSQTNPHLINVLWTVSPFPAGNYQQEEQRRISEKNSEKQRRTAMPNSEFR